VCGCKDLTVDYKSGTVRVKHFDGLLKAGDWITVDGHTGHVYQGQVPTSASDVVRVISGELAPSESELYGYFTAFLSWTDEVRHMAVRANADTPTDARIARRFGAQGIGLCRTEHMFFQGDRIDAVRQMIVADSSEERRAALAKIEPLQRSDFEGIFREMDGLPVTIRTLDPPLHEFLPHGDSEVAELAKKLGVDVEKLHHKIEGLREANPMLGFRGCRLGIIYPEITEMQARAIFEAAANVQQQGIKVIPEVMIPLVATRAELQMQADLVRKVATAVMAETGQSIEYLVGTMIELPRAALTADKIAEVADFFSFGTNDLTQTALGLSRDDSGRFLPDYVEKKIFRDDPFQSIDQDGVGQLVKIGVEKGRATSPTLKIGVCGEHGGDPESIRFFHGSLDYVSCSPFRVAIARLAAAQSAMEK